MRISPISSMNNSPRKVLSKQNVSSTKTSPSFMGSYHEAHKLALSKDFGKNYNTVVDTFWNLLVAAKSEKNIITSKYADLLDCSFMKVCLLKLDKLRNPDKEVVMPSRNYNSPLITAIDGALSFHDPTDGEFSAGTISFWYERRNNTVNVLRPNDYHSFYDNRNIRQYYRMCNGVMVYNKYYNRDGSKSFWKNLLLT